MSTVTLELAILRIGVCAYESHLMSTVRVYVSVELHISSPRNVKLIPDSGACGSRYFAIDSSISS